MLRNHILVVLAMLLPMSCYAETVETVATINDNTSTVRVLITQAANAEKKGDFQAAIDLQKKILVLEPTNIESLSKLANLYNKTDQYNDGFIWAKKALALDANYELANIAYGNALLGFGRYAEAKAVFEKVLKTNPNSALAAYGLGEIADEQEDFSSAGEYYQQAIDLDPKFADAYVSLGVAYANMYDYEDAIAAFKKALIIDPDSADAKAMLKHFETYKKPPPRPEPKAGGHH